MHPHTERIAGVVVASLTHVQFAHKQVTKYLLPEHFLQYLENPLPKMSQQKRGVETTKRCTKIKLN